MFKESKLDSNKNNNSSNSNVIDYVDLDRTTTIVKEETDKTDKTDKTVSTQGNYTITKNMKIPTQNMKIPYKGNKGEPLLKPPQNVSTQGNHTFDRNSEVQHKRKNRLKKSKVKDNEVIYHTPPEDNDMKGNNSSQEGDCDDFQIPEKSSESKTDLNPNPSSNDTTNIKLLKEENFSNPFQLNYAMCSLIVYCVYNHNQFSCDINLLVNRGSFIMYISKDKCQVISGIVLNYLGEITRMEYEHLRTYLNSKERGVIEKLGNLILNSQDIIKVSDHNKKLSLYKALLESSEFHTFVKRMFSSNTMIIKELKDNAYGVPKKIWNNERSLKQVIATIICNLNRYIRDNKGYISDNKGYISDNKVLGTQEYNLEITDLGYVATVLKRIHWIKNYSDWTKNYSDWTKNYFRNFFVFDCSDKYKIEKSVLYRCSDLNLEDMQDFTSIFARAIEIKKSAEKGLSDDYHTSKNSSHKDDLKRKRNEITKKNSSSESRRDNNKDNNDNKNGSKYKRNHNHSPSFSEKQNNSSDNCSNFSFGGQKNCTDNDSHFSFGGQKNCSDNGSRFSFRDQKNCTHNFNLSIVLNSDNSLENSPNTRSFTVQNNSSNDSNFKKSDSFKKMTGSVDKSLNSMNDKDTKKLPNTYR